MSRVTGRIEGATEVAIDGGLITRPIIRTVLLSLAFAVAAMVSAHIRVWLPLSPVPVTMQTFVVLLAGLCLGATWGGIGMAKYLALGVVGLPAFTGGAAALLGPSGGYLVGFIAGAVVVGGVYSRLRTTFGAILACLLGSLVIYLFGCSWLGALTGFDVSRLFAIGVAPFLAGDLLKLFAAVLLVRGPFTGPLAARIFAHR